MYLQLDKVYTISHYISEIPDLQKRSILMVCQSKIARSQAGRSSAARVSSAAPKKKSFDRGGPVWPPRSNVTNDRLRGGLGGLCPPSQKPGGLGGSAPQPKPKNFRKNAKIYVYTFVCLFKVELNILGYTALHRSPDVDGIEPPVLYVRRSTFNVVWAVGRQRTVEAILLCRGKNFF